MLSSEVPSSNKWHLKAFSSYGWKQRRAKYKIVKYCRLLYSVSKEKIWKQCDIPMHHAPQIKLRYKKGSCSRVKTRKCKNPWLFFFQSTCLAFTVSLQVHNVLLNSYMTHTILILHFFERRDFGHNKEKFGYRHGGDCRPRRLPCGGCWPLSLCCVRRHSNNEKETVIVYVETIWVLSCQRDKTSESKLSNPLDCFFGQPRTFYKFRPP